MAILENETKHYYKIIFDECSITGKTVFVKFYVYATAADRDREKSRRTSLGAFFQNLRQACFSAQEALLAKGEEFKQRSENPLDENDEVKSAYPELKALQQRFFNLDRFEVWSSNAVYKFGDDAIPPCPSNLSPQELEALGFNKQWVNDPVKITMSGQANCGEYKGEPITEAFYYNRLKTVLCPNICDC